MKKLWKYAPFQFTLFLIVGIVTQFNFGIWSFGILEMGYIILLLLFMLWLLRGSRIYCIAVWLSFFFMGVAIVFLQNDKNYPSYFGHHDLKEATFIVRLDRALKGNIHYNKYEASVLNVNGEESLGRIVLHIKKDTLVNYRTGTVMATKQEMLAVKPPLNPYQFDYKSFLNNKGISFQMFIQNSDQYIVQGMQPTLLTWAEDIRRNIQSSLKESGFSEDVFAVMNALLLGDRHDLSEELKTDFAKAGAIHILAVSGLHVGILFLICSYLFKPLERFKNGKVFKTIVIVFILWIFTLLAGLSASVVRAVAMFTFIAIGMLSNRPSSALQSLIASMFLLLLVNPKFLFDVGFQLSYLAVFGIVWIQPKLYRFWNPRNSILRKTWQLITVSLGAQLMVLPLSLYYFHQFPGLFMLSNLIIVPLLGFILTGGIIVILLSTIQLLPSFLMDAYSILIDGLNLFISWVAKQEAFLIADISFSLLMIFATYLFIIGLVRVLDKWCPRRVVIALSAVVCFQCVVLMESRVKSQEQSLIVFHEFKKTVIGRRKGSELQVFKSPNKLEIEKFYSIDSYKIGTGISVDYQAHFPHFFQFQDRIMIIVDQERIYEFEGLNNPVVLLKASPKINLERLINRLDPEIIIADGSNYKSYIEKWRNTCIKKKTPFWDTYQNGAYIIRE